MTDVPRILILESRYNDDVAANLLAGATRALDRAGASHDTILEETPVENVLAMFDTIRQYGN